MGDHKEKLALKLLENDRLVQQALDEVFEYSIDERCELFINELKELREDSGTSTAKLAQLTGLKQPNITRIETLTKGANPKLETVMKMLRALGGDIIIVNPYKAKAGKEK